MLMGIWPNSTGMVPDWSLTLIVQMVLIGCVSMSRGQEIGFRNAIFKNLCVCGTLKYFDFFEQMLRTCLKCVMADTRLLLDPGLSWSLIIYVNKYTVPLISGSKYVFIKAESVNLQWRRIFPYFQIEMMASASERVNLDAPIWDQNTFLGRLKYYAWVTDPRLSMVSNSKLFEAQTLVKQYRYE